MVELEVDGKVIKTLFTPVALPCIGDVLVIKGISYKVKSRTIDYDESKIRVILRK